MEYASTGCDHPSSACPHLRGRLQYYQLHVPVCFTRSMRVKDRWFRSVSMSGIAALLMLMLIIINVILTLYYVNY